MSTNPEMLAQLLARGVPWPLAVEAAASTALDHDERAQTIALEQSEEPQEP
jgi:hypothetical protein